MTEKLDAFTAAFFRAALWTSTDNSRDDGGDPLDKRYTIADIDPTCLATLAAECASFQDEFGAALGLPGRAERAGHDLWLTRNRHGSGFWDGDWPEALGEILSDAAQRLGTVDLYVGDDGVIYASGYEKGVES